MSENSTEPLTPLCDLFERLLSHGLSPDAVLKEVRIVEEALTKAAIVSRHVSASRDKERIRKANYRKRKRGTGSGTPALDLESSSISKSQESKKKESKKDSQGGTVPSPEDGWPADYEKQFWESFPKKRRYDQPQVLVLLAKLRREKTVTWEVLFAGLARYVASDPGEYAKAPLPWLRGHRWAADYGKQISTGGSNGEQSNRRNGGSSDPILAAARRRGGAMRGDGQASGREDAIPPSGRMDDGRGGSRGSEEPTLDLDLAPRPGGRFP